MADSYIDPSPANFQAFKDLPRDEPIHMLNLLEYREQAEYPQGHEHVGKGWSGRRAYEEYGKTSGPIFRRVGGGHLQGLAAARGDQRAGESSPEQGAGPPMAPLERGSVSGLQRGKHWGGFCSQGCWRKEIGAAARGRVRGQYRPRSGPRPLPVSMP